MDAIDLFYSIIPLHQLVRLVLLSTACGAISMVLTKATVFNLAHDWLDKNFPFVGKLFDCPWCTSHWVAALLVCIYNVDVVYGMRPAWSYLGFLRTPLYIVDFGVNVFIMVVLSAVSARIISAAYHE